jgi:repressor LexA
VLQVAGDSLCEAGILDGDYVVIEQRDHARNGEIVVALIRGEEVTLKRIVQEPGRVLLYPENSAMQAMEYHPDEVQIQGVLVGQMRSQMQAVRGAMQDGVPPESELVSIRFYK